MGSLHPAIVHIPIGLLVAYSLVELFCGVFPRYRQQLQMGLFVMLLVGVVGGLFALQSGEALEHFRRSDHQLVEMHSFFASVTVWVYALLLGAHSVRIINQHSWWKSRLAIWTVSAKLWPLIDRIAQFVYLPGVRYPFAAGGLLFITITGALGGALAHGPEADPLVSFVYHLLIN